MAKTIDVMKAKRKVSERVRNNIKAFNKLKKLIINSLKEEQKTIPELAEEIDFDIDVITYHLMTLIKYGFIEAGEIDEDDEYYYYKLKNKK